MPLVWSQQPWGGFGFIERARGVLYTGLEPDAHRVAYRGCMCQFQPSRKPDLVQRRPANRSQNPPRLKAAAIPNRSQNPPRLKATAIPRPMPSPTQSRPHTFAGAARSPDPPADLPPARNEAPANSSKAPRRASTTILFETDCVEDVGCCRLSFPPIFPTKTFWCLDVKWNMERGVFKGEMTCGQSRFRMPNSACPRHRRRRTPALRAL